MLTGAVHVTALAIVESGHARLRRGHRENLNFDCGILYIASIMACSLRLGLRFKDQGLHTLKLHRVTRSKVVRLCCTDNSKTLEKPVTANSAEKKNTHILQRRIKNELSYALPTVPLPTKLTEAVKEVLKSERSIRVLCET